MFKVFRKVLPAVALVVLASALTPVRAADQYTIDGVHSSVSFKIQHAGISWVHGRFNEFSGAVIIDSDNPGKSAFNMTLNTTSVDTNNAKRDEHLRNADFFDVKMYPEMTFKSTSVKLVEGGYEVTGDFTMHGKTKPITITVKGGKTTEFPPKTVRIGFTTELVLKRTDFGMDKMVGPVGDEVHISIGFEAVKK